MWYLPNFFRNVTVEQVHLPYEMRTNAEVLAYANAYFRPRPSRPVEIYMMCDIAQSIITFCCCTYVLLKKGRMKDARIVTLCQSPSGVYIVPNVIFTLVGMFSVYLCTFAIFCAYILYVQFSQHPLGDWLFYIPLPWLPLALAAFYSTYGFVITCSPRSPISNLIGKRRKGLVSPRLSLMHLPLPHSAWVMNAFMLSVGILMVVYNIVITTFSGIARNRTHEAQNDVYGRLLTKVHSQDWLNATPTEETLLLVRRGACSLMNVYRWCCAALASYVALIVITAAMLVLYSIPNHIFLLDHLCHIFPDKDRKQPAIGTLLGNIKTLWKMGSPRNLQGPSYSAFKKTWMITMVGHSCTIAILAGVLLFSVAPIYLIFSIATTLTFDDIFNSVSGLGNPKGTTSFNRNHHSLSVSAGPSSTMSTGIPSPQSPTFATSSQSPALLTSPSQLRPMPSFTPSSIGSQGEKTFADEMRGDPRIIRVLVVTETTVHVDYEDIEAVAVEDGIHSSADMCPGALPVCLLAAKPRSFLSRNKSWRL
ncbi:hypothetical protein EX895_005074 [Sporisorium graminicola]|uniref:Uncharacterized protein n=1 Tax=Sporisorium graminicola TaxID=280036 RepID=A0A4V6ETD9_9BASI|nr:hypothetical protein EX895_005074 [Sporisorium graminicola]TKY86249.1 hypothetical protein EX895_005074 [Sporisorium graminicola]